jgi:hypothetical protein
MTAGLFHHHEPLHGPDEIVALDHYRRAAHPAQPTTKPLALIYAAGN